MFMYNKTIRENYKRFSQKYTLYICFQQTCEIFLFKILQNFCYSNVRKDSVPIFIEIEKERERERVRARASTLIPDICSKMTTINFRPTHDGRS